MRKRQRKKNRKKWLVRAVRAYGEYLKLQRENYERLAAYFREKYGQEG